MNATIVSADELKKDIAGYMPERAEEFHEKSAKLADKKFDELLKSSSHPRVILMSGGPASGKTEFVSEYLFDQNVLVFDGILPSEQGADIKISHIRKSGKELVIYAVWPEDMRAAYVAFLNRDRKFTDRHFYEKHANARRTLLWIAEKYSNIDIKIFKSAYMNKDLYFTEIVLASKNDLIAFIKENQYSKEDIVELITR